MLQQHHADRLRPGSARETLGAQPRQVEAGHDVGHTTTDVAIDLAHPLLAVGGVGDREQRVGVRVVDEAIRQDRVQDRLDRRRRRRGVASSPRAAP